jgi:response regulator NasT
MSRQYRILIVDDSTSSRAALVEGLRSLSCVIVGEASDAHTGLGLVRRLRPDLVFIAIGLPEIDGIAAARQIMEEAPTPIVILSRHRDAEMIRGATEAGVMTYLIKPLRNEELQPAIELAIGRFHECTTLRNENANLKRALEERKVIERAKGILMERAGLTEEEAFVRVRTASMKSRKPMVEIARALLTAEEVSKGSANVPISQARAAGSEEALGNTEER